MRIKLGIAMSALFVVTTVSPVLAHEGHAGPHELSLDTLQQTATTPATRTVINKEMTEEVVKSPVKVMRKDLKADIKEMREEAKEAAEVRRDVLREKISVMKDAQKKAVLQRLDNRFVMVNDTTTDKWAGALEKMTLLVDRVGSEAADLKASGVNTTALDASIIRARTAITTAQTAVTTQAGKTYVMSITTEAAASTSANTTVTQLRTDLRSTFLLVQSAKQAVRSSVLTLKIAKKTPIEPTPVASGSANIGE